MNTKLLDVDEVADILRCSTYSVREHIRAGRLPASKPLGRWLVREDDLEALLRDSANPVPAPLIRRRRRRRTA